MGNHGEQEERKEWRMAHYRAAHKNDKLIINLRDISHIMRLLYEGRGSQKRILIILQERGGMTQRELTGRLGIQPGSASEVIAKLEHAGYLTRTPSKTDHRTTEIALTGQGKSSALEALDERKRRHEEMFSCLSGEEKDTLLSLLEKINADWENRYRDVEEKRECGRPHGGCRRHPHKENQ